MYAQFYCFINCCSHCMNDQSWMFCENFVCMLDIDCQRSISSYIYFIESRFFMLSWVFQRLRCLELFLHNCCGYQQYKKDSFYGRSEQKIDKDFNYFSPYQKNKNSRRNNKYNNYMIDNSNKENYLMEKAFPQNTTFHFCERYTKKSQRRVKTEINQPQPRMIIGSKIALKSKGKKMLEQQKDEKNNQRKLSNFEILKRKISYLESEDFIGQKHCRNSLREEENYPQNDYIVTGQFGYTRRIVQLEKYRHNVKISKKEHQKRKQTLNLVLNTNARNSYSRLAINFPHQSDVEGQSQLLKKRQIVSQCAKRYYRPQSFHKGSKQSQRVLHSVAEIKGIRMQQTGRAHKSHIDFY